MSLVKKAQQIITTIVENYGETKIHAIDATVGNGNDTLFLARLVGNSGHVYGFDIQASAIEATNTLLTEHELKYRVTLLQSGHEHMISALRTSDTNNCVIIMFNLGYLPRGDKIIVTQAETSLAAIQQSHYLLDPGGVISILAYPGHQGGFEETNQVRTYIENLSPSEFHQQRYLGDTSNPNSPELYIIEKQLLT